MSDRGRRSEREPVEREPSERDRIERNLEELGSRVEYPATPNLASAVRQHLDEDPVQHPARSGLPRPPFFSPRWAAAIVVLVVVVSLPLLSQSARDTVSGIFMSEGASGGAASSGAGGEAAPPDERAGSDGTVSEAASDASSSPDAAATGAGKEFGALLTLEQAQERLDGQLVLPRALDLGEPEEVYAIGETRSEGVAVVYVRRASLPSVGDTGAGLVLVEIPGDLRSVYPGGDLGEIAGVEETTVKGGRGYWAPGGEELPTPLDRSVHPTANVLIWEQGGLVLRLETELPRGEAVWLAESVG